MKQSICYTFLTFISYTDIFSIYWIIFDNNRWKISCISFCSLLSSSWTPSWVSERCEYDMPRSFWRDYGRLHTNCWRLILASFKFKAAGTFIATKTIRIIFYYKGIYDPNKDAKIVASEFNVTWLYSSTWIIYVQNVDSRIIKIINIQ